MDAWRMAADGMDAGRRAGRGPVLLLALLGLALFPAPRPAHAQALTIVSWNAESGGANPDTIAALMARHFGAIDIWGFSEVTASWADELEAGAEAAGNAEYGMVLGTTGGADRLLILYNDDRLNLLGSEELQHINIGGRVRAPLVARFMDERSGAQFAVVINHLYRSNAGARHEQSTLLNTWAAATDGAVIALGDFNYDWEVEGGDGDHDLGYDNLTANGTFRWLRPDPLVRTQCTRFESGGVPACRYDSVLDFIFVAGESQEWDATSRIMTWTSDFPDDPFTPDHRPILATFTFGAGGGDVADGLSAETVRRLLERIAALERELAAIRALLEGRND